MIITAISQQKRNKSVYNIFVDYEFVCGLDDETIYNMKLKEGMEVNTELLKQTAEISAYKKALNYCINLLARNCKTKYELIKKLKEKEYGEETIKSVITKLLELGYLNDEAYAEAYIRNKQEANQTINKRTLYGKMLQKGIDKELIQQTIENAELDEYQIAVKAAEKKLRALKGNSQEKKAKLYAYLYGKGFDYETCSKVVNNIEITE